MPPLALCCCLHPRVLYCCLRRLTSCRRPRKSWRSSCQQRDQCSAHLRPRTRCPDLRPHRCCCLGRRGRETRRFRTPCSACRSIPNARRRTGHTAPAGRWLVPCRRRRRPRAADQSKDPPSARRRPRRTFAPRPRQKERPRLCCRRQLWRRQALGSRARDEDCL
jgi:hypothetical protein